MSTRSGVSIARSSRSGSSAVSEDGTVLLPAGLLVLTDPRPQPRERAARLPDRVGALGHAAGWRLATGLNVGDVALAALLEPMLLDQATRETDLRLAAVLSPVGKLAAERGPQRRRAVLRVGPGHAIHGALPA